MVVFAQQSIIKDPPFTKLDLLSCRNLLIYFSSKLQKKLFPIFHYSLKPGGILFLGSSESIGMGTDMFTPEDKKWKLFKRKPSETIAAPVFELPAPVPQADLPGKNFPEPVRKVRDVDTLLLLKMMLQQSDLPPSVIIDDHADIIYIHGRTGRFLEPAEGETSNNILEMARPDLKAPLTAAIRKMAADRKETIIKNLQIRENGGCVTVRVTVRPVPDFYTGIRGVIMVIFEESPLHVSRAVNPKQIPNRNKSEQIRKLEEELQYTRENLQTTIEKLETSNEELKSTNEELQSTNEELQSTNEELETSKEELQSLNEESATVNAELQNRIDELSKNSDDMKNLLAATQIATIFLDMDLCIHRFTPKVGDIIPLTAGDAGRPIDHFASNLIDVEIKHFAGKVLDDLVTRDVEVASKTGRDYLMRVMPYRTVNNLIDGIVITFNEYKKNRADTHLLAALMRDSYDAIILQDLKGHILAWNRGATRLYGWSEEEALKMNADIIIPEDKREETRSVLKKALREDIPPFITQYVNKAGKPINVLLTITKVADKNNAFIAIATTGRDIREIDTLERLVSNFK